MLNPLTWLFGLNRLFAKLESFLLVSTLIIMLVLSALQVILRNFFDTGIDWGDVFARHLVLWLGFFGATLSTNENRHIRLDALVKAVPEKWHPLVDIVVNCFCIAVGYLLAFAAYRFMLSERAAETVLFLGIPTWYFLTIMPVGFAVITFRHIVLLIEQLLKFGGKKVPEPKAHEHSELEVSLKIKLK